MKSIDETKDEEEEERNNNNGEATSKRSVQFDGNDPYDDSLRPSRRLGERQKSKHIDLATGRMTTRQQSVLHVTNTEAQQARSRFTKMKSLFRSSRRSKKQQAAPSEQLSTTVDEEQVPEQGKQFRIRSTGTYTKRPLWEASNEATASMIGNYLTWTFKTSLWCVAFASFIHFTILILLFAVCIYGAGRYQPECIVGDEDESPNFVHAYHLSWTTLSTVGYGVTAPQPPSEEDRWCVRFVIVLIVAPIFHCVLFFAKRFLFDLYLFTLTSCSSLLHINCAALESTCFARLNPSSVYCLRV